MTMTGTMRKRTAMKTTTIEWIKELASGVVFVVVVLVLVLVLAFALALAVVVVAVVIRVLVVLIVGTARRVLEKTSVAETANARTVRAVAVVIAVVIAGAGHPRT